MDRVNIKSEGISQKNGTQKSAVINVEIRKSYSNEIIKYNDLNVKLINGNSILLNDLLEDLIQRGSDLNNTGISYYDNDLKTYIFCGIFPFYGNLNMPFTVEDNSNTTIRLRSRQIVHKDNLMRMEFNEENPDQDENNNNVYINHKSKRSKERKIGYIIEKVFLWRKLYNGFIDENGNHIKMTLEEAAEKVGISKKSLDDYLIQLRIGKQHGFMFNEHKNDKVGVLRAFVKKHRYYEETKSSLNIHTNLTSNLTFNGTTKN